MTWRGTCCATDQVRVCLFLPQLFALATEPSSHRHVEATLDRGAKKHPENIEPIRIAAPVSCMSSEIRHQRSTPNDFATTKTNSSWCHPPTPRSAWAHDNETSRCCLIGVFQGYASPWRARKDPLAPKRIIPKGLVGWQWLPKVLSRCKGEC